MRFSLALLTLATIAAPLSAAPQVGEDTVTVRIAFADIDLSDAADRAKLEKRIDAQIESACTLETNSRLVMGRTIVDDKCVSEARAAAFAQVERVAAAEARSGREVAAN